jgi:hypothetical protein
MTTISGFTLLNWQLVGRRPIDDLNTPVHTGVSRRRRRRAVCAHAEERGRYLAVEREQHR